MKIIDCQVCWKKMDFVMTNEASLRTVKLETLASRSQKNTEKVSVNP